jgi:hypothetical protein
MAIPNSDFVPAESFPGARTGADSTGAVGTPGASGPGADDVRTIITFSGGSWQPSARVTVSTNGSILAGQTDDSPISPGPESDYSSTGAGSGRAGHYRRYSWQQPDEGRR